MKAHVIGNTAAADDTQKLGAFLNARMRSVVCESNFSAAQKIQGARVQMALQDCYNCREVYLTYRKTFIAVKVDQPVGVADKKNLKLLHFVVGDQDVLHEADKRLAALLTKAGIELTFQPVSGMHEYKVWRQGLYETAPLLFTSVK